MLIFSHGNSGAISQRAFRKVSNEATFDVDPFGFACVGGNAQPPSGKAVAATSASGRTYATQTDAKAKHAAYITPDMHPLESYFVDKVRNNVEWYSQYYLGGGTVNNLGFLEHGPIAYAPNGIAAKE